MRGGASQIQLRLEYGRFGLMTGDAPTGIEPALGKKRLRTGHGSHSGGGVFGSVSFERNGEVLLDRNVCSGRAAQDEHTPIAEI